MTLSLNSAPQSQQRTSGRQVSKSSDPPFVSPSMPTPLMSLPSLPRVGAAPFSPLLQRHHRVECSLAVAAELQQAVARACEERCVVRTRHEQLEDILDLIPVSWRFTIWGL